MGNRFTVCGSSQSHHLHDLREDLFGPHAELIVSAANGGTILTMNDSVPTVEALAVKGGKIIRMGKAEDVLSLKGIFTKVIKLKDDETLMPGLIEPHTHTSIMTEFLSGRMNDLSAFTTENPTGASIRQKMSETVKKAQAASQPPEWIVFSGWDPVLVPDLIKPDFRLNAKWLDEKVTDEFAVLVLQQSLHCCWLNTKGLKLCGMKDNPTGQVKEPAGMEQVMKHISQPSGLELVGLLLNAMRTYSERGFTTVTDMGTLPLDKLVVSALSFVTLLPEFPVRWGIYYNVFSKYVPSINRVNDKLWFPGVKFWADGSPYVGTMCCSERYHRTALTEGLEFDFGHPYGVLDNPNTAFLVKKLTPFKDRLIAVHSHGDKAVEQALNVYDQLIHARSDSGSSPANVDHRYRLDHVGQITKDQLIRAQQMGVTVTFFTDHVYYYGEALGHSIIGHERASRFAPAGLASKCGHRHWTLHQDSPCSPLHPFLCMKNAILRKTMQHGDVLGPEYCITIQEALKAYTINAAWQLKRDDEIGSLEEGKLGDFVYLSNNPLNMEPEKLPDIKVIATFIGGHRFDPKPLS